MAKSDYIAVTGDDWYQRRRQDDEGEFFRKVANQGPRKGEGGSTRQGVYCLTADGTLLAYKNAGQAPEVMRQVLRDGLAAWRKLPANRRKPGAVAVGRLSNEDRAFVRQPPAGGAIVNVYTRWLDRDGNGGICDADCEKGRGDEAARDHLWLTRRDCASLLPAQPHVGQRIAMDSQVADRIVRFHLVDNTLGEPPFWEEKHVQSSELTLTVLAADDRSARFRLDGRALLSTNADVQKSKRGFDVALIGEIAMDRNSRRPTRFDLVALGEHWGEGPFTRGARPDRSLLGIAFALSDGATPADRVPPQAARYLRGYLGGQE